MFHVDLPIQLHAQTYNALSQRTLWNYWLRLILWPISMQNGRIWHQLDLEIPQLSTISADASESFTTPMHELVNKYAAIFTKPGKPVAQVISTKSSF